MGDYGHAAFLASRCSRETCVDTFGGWKSMRDGKDICGECALTEHREDEVPESEAS